MSNEGFQYQKIFQTLKYKIESGLMPKGCVLPSSARLCREYKVSDKTIRRVFAMLTDEGLIETRERKRAVVIFDKSMSVPPVQTLKEPDPAAMTDVFKTGELLCHPLICRGMSLCCEDDWAISEQLICQMDPAFPSLFWKNSKLFWRFFIAKCNNELALCAVDSLGFLELEYKSYSVSIRINYKNDLLEFVNKVKSYPYTEAELQNLLSEFFNLTPVTTKHFESFVPEDSPFRTGILNTEKWEKIAEEHYMTVYLDILGLIAAGGYRPGDQLPSHIILQRRYGVSVTTTLQAIQMLKQQGVVETIRGRGIFVSADLPALDNISIPRRLIVKYSKQYLETVELLTITVRGVALHTAMAVSREQVQILLQNVKEMKDVSNLYQPAPIVILEFLTDHLPCGGMRAVYMTLLENYHIGRKIPNLVNPQNASKKLELHRRCVSAVQALLDGHSEEFAKQTAEMFYYTQQQTISEYRRLNYLEALEPYKDSQV